MILTIRPGFFRVFFSPDDLDQSILRVSRSLIPGNIGIRKAKNPGYQVTVGAAIVWLALLPSGPDAIRRDCPQQAQYHGAGYSTAEDVKVNWNAREFMGKFPGAIRWSSPCGWASRYRCNPGHAEIPRGLDSLHLSSSRRPALHQWSSRPGGYSPD